MESYAHDHNSAVLRTCMYVLYIWCVQVRVLNLQGKNYIFTLAPTFHPVAEAGCTAAASKTRKNIIITLQVCF